MAAPLKIFCRNCHAKLDVGEFEPFETVDCPVCGTRLRVPMRFDRYLLEKVCGKGGNSLVYRAIEPELARRVAIKIQNADSDDDDISAQYVNAARISGMVEHRSIIPVFNCGTFGNRAFLVMRFMEHGDLEQMLKKGTLPDWKTIAGWCVQIVSGLQEAMKHNIVHHDIKPANIMLTADDEAKIGDFDLADIREPGDMSSPCREWASPIYASPERILGGGEDFRGDIFSMGVTLYELLTGRAPFGLHGTPLAMYERRKRMEFIAMRELNRELPEAIEALVGRMIDFEPERRPGYDEVKNVLQKSIGSGCGENSAPEKEKTAGGDWFRRS